MFPSPPPSPSPINGEGIYSNPLGSSPPLRGGDKGEGGGIRPEDFFNEILRRDTRFPSSSSCRYLLPPLVSFMK